MSDEKVIKILKKHNTDFAQMNDKLREHDSNFARIDDKLREHDSNFARIDDKLCEHDSNFARIDDKLCEHDAKFDRIYDELSDHKYDIEWLKANVATKDDLTKIYEMLDRILSMTTINTQEREMLQREVERHDTRITHLEQTVGVA